MELWLWKISRGRAGSMKNTGLPFPTLGSPLGALLVKSKWELEGQGAPVIQRMEFTYKSTNRTDSRSRIKEVTQCISISGSSPSRHKVGPHIPTILEIKYSMQLTLANVTSRYESSHSPFHLLS